MLTDEVLGAERRWTYERVIEHLGDEADEFVALLKNPQAITAAIVKALNARGVPSNWSVVDSWRHR